MYIFWDNSNIHYAGLNQVLPRLEPEVQKKLIVHISADY